MSANLPADPTAAFRLDGKVVLITGASAGIGHRFARIAHAAGAQVAVAARRLDRLNALTAELPGTLAIRADLGRRDELDVPVAGTVQHFGRVDVLVNSAGMSITAAATEESADQFASVLDLNLTASFAVAAAAARDMFAREASGSIINIASILGQVGIGRIPQGSYVASKGGVIALTRELSAQWSARGIRVNALAPGFFPTEMTAGLFAEEAGQRFIARNTTMRRGGAEHELDGALLFLASDASSYMTGQTLTVDGGWTAI